MAQEGVDNNGLKSETGWEDLPLHLLDSIMEKLKTKEYLQLDLVCSIWHSASLTKHGIEKRMKLSSKEVPLLLMPDKDNPSHGLLYDITTSKFLKERLLVPSQHQRFVSSSLGWLVSVETDFTVQLHKPRWFVEGDESSATDSITIRLPQAFYPRPTTNTNFPSYSHYRAIISADPLTNPNQCVVMIILEMCSSLAYIRPGKDAKWTYIDIHCEDVIFCKDQFFALTTDGEIVSIKLTDEPFSINDIKVIAPKSPHWVEGNMYLVELNGKLVQILRRLLLSHELRIDGVQQVVARKTTKVLVLEYDFNAEKWVKVENLDGFAIFLGDNSSMSLPASNLWGCKPNCIYFTHDIDSSWSSIDLVEDFCLYNHEQRSMEYGFGLDKNSLEGVLKRVPLWIVPYSLYLC